METGYRAPRHARQFREQLKFQSPRFEKAPLCRPGCIRALYQRHEPGTYLESIGFVPPTLQDQALPLSAVSSSNVAEVMLELTSLGFIVAISVIAPGDMVTGVPVISIAAVYLPDVLPITSAAIGGQNPLSP